MNDCVFYQPVEPPECVLFNTRLFDCVMCSRTASVNPYDNHPDLPWRPWDDEEPDEESSLFCACENQLTIFEEIVKYSYLF